MKSYLPLESTDFGIGTLGSSGGGGGRVLVRPLVNLSLVVACLENIIPSKGDKFLDFSLEVAMMKLVR